MTTSRRVAGMISSAVALLLFLPACHCRAILGIDLGSLYMKVALVQSGAPLEIVTNLHSKRKTEQMVLLETKPQLQRFYGADAASLIARKALSTPTMMSVMLGRDELHPAVKILSERHYPLVPIYNATRFGLTLPVNEQYYTPEELVAMVLTHAVDISVAHAASQAMDSHKIVAPQDIVLTTPVHTTQNERVALLDAAALAGLNVLALLDETTAAALQYAMDKQFDKEQLFLFYNMGASATQVALVRYFSYEQPQKYGKPKTIPAVEVLAKAWDATLGGEAFDHVLVEYLADQFNQLWRGGTHHASEGDKDIRTVPRAMTKLRLQANKVKHVLSANTEIPIYLESVHDDISLQTVVSRRQFEDLVAPLLARAIRPVQQVLQQANKTMDDLTELELIGGGMRIPRVQAELSQLFSKQPLGLHINADESMALGAAFCGANLSTAFRVRPVGLTDIHPFALSVTLQDLPTGQAKLSEKDEVWNKQATLFEAFGKLGVKKTIAFTHDQDVHCELDYKQDGDSLLPEGTEPSVARYNITGVSKFAEEMAQKNLGRPKVSLQFELSASGITALVKAEAAVEEVYTVEEEIEIVDDESNATNTSANATVAAGEASKNKTNRKTKETQPKKSPTNSSSIDNDTSSSNSSDATLNANDTDSTKKTKKVTVQKEKKRTHRRTLKVDTYYVGKVRPLTPELLLASKNKLYEMARKDKERMMLEESRNRVESYIYKIKNKLDDDEDTLAQVSTEAQRDEVRKLAMDAEEWLDGDGYKADLATMEDKFAEISIPFEKILLRVKELSDLPAAIAALQKKLTDVEQLMVKWETTMPQVTAEERGNVLEKVEDVRKWIIDREAAQAHLKPHEEPVFLSTDVPSQFNLLEPLVVRLSRKPKLKAAKNTTKSENTTAFNSTHADKPTFTSEENAQSSETASDTTPLNSKKSKDAPVDGSANGTEGDLEDEL